MPKTGPDTTAAMTAADKARGSFERMRGALQASFGSLPEPVAAILTEHEKDLTGVKEACATLGRRCRDALRERRAAKDAEAAEVAEELRSADWRIAIDHLHRAGVQYGADAAAKAARKGLSWLKVRAIAYVFEHNRGKLKGPGELYNRLTEHGADEPPLRCWSDRVAIPPFDPEDPLRYHLVKLACDLDEQRPTPEKRAATIERFFQWANETLNVERDGSRRRT